METYNHRPAVPLTLCLPVGTERNIVAQTVKFLKVPGLSHLCFQAPTDFKAEKGRSFFNSVGCGNVTSSQLNSFITAYVRNVYCSVKHGNNYNVHESVQKQILNGKKKLKEIESREHAWKSVHETNIRACENDFVITTALIINCTVPVLTKLSRFLFVRFK